MNSGGFIRGLRGSGRNVGAVMWVLAVMPASKLKVIADAVGGVDIYTNTALSLHDYRYNGPDPDMALSKFGSRGEVAEYVLRLVGEVARRVEALRGRIKRPDELDRALAELRGGLGR